MKNTAADTILDRVISVVTQRVLGTTCRFFDSYFLSFSHRFSADPSTHSGSDISRFRDGICVIGIIISGINIEGKKIFIVMFP